MNSQIKEALNINFGLLGFIYRVDVLSVVVEVVCPTQLVVHGVDGAGLDGAGHVVGLGHVAGTRARAPHHVAPGETVSKVCLLLLSLPSPTAK